MFMIIVYLDFEWNFSREEIGDGDQIIDFGNEQLLRACKGMIMSIIL